MSVDGQPQGTVHNTSEQAFQYAEEQGLHVVLPMENELFIDIDDARGKKTFDQNYDLLKETYGCTILSARPSRSGGNKQHIVIAMKRAVTPVERIALQAALGSDARREAHSLRRVIEGDFYPTLFFEVKK